MASIKAERVDVAEEAQPDAPMEIDDDDDPDDPVVREMDVYLSQAQHESILLLQCPLRPSGRFYGDKHEIPEVRIKPNQQKIEFKYSMNTKNIAYDQETGSDIAASTARSEADDNKNAALYANKGKGGGLDFDGEVSSTKMYQSGMMDKLLLKSAAKVPMNATYMVGVLEKDGLYLNPIKGISQLRPGFDHLDESDSIAQEKNKTTAEEDDDDNETKAINVTIKKRESERQAAARKRSHAHLQKESDAEPWTNLVYHARTTEEAGKCLDKLAPGTSHAPIGFCEPEQWLSELTLHTTPNREGERNPESEPFSLLTTIKLPIVERVITLLKIAEVLQYSDLCRYAGKNMSYSALNDVLIDCARLVHGVWVIKSERLYSQSRENLAKMCCCRNYVLCKLRAREEITRSQIKQLFSLTLLEAEMVLEKIARRPEDRGRSWIFIEDEDVNFVQAFPTMVLRDTAAWKKDFANIDQQSEQYTNGAVDDTMPVHETTTTEEQIQLSPEEVLMNTLVDQTDDVQRCLEKMCQVGLSSFGICSLELFKKVIKLKKKSAPSASVWSQENVTVEMIKTALDNLGAVVLEACTDENEVMIATCYIFKRVPGCSEPFDQLRTIILNRFAEIKKTQKKNIKTECDTQGLKFNHNAYNKIMKELAKSVSTYWILKDGSGYN